MAMFIPFLCLLLAAGHMTQARVKRSDDPNPLTGVVENLSAQLSSVLARLGSLETKQGSLDTRQGSLDTKQESMDTKLRSLDTKQASMDTQLASLQHQAVFMAHFSQLTLAAPLSAPLRFNQVSFNDGNDYDKELGVFIAPFDGVYTFSAQVYTRVRERSQIDILTNGSIVSRMATDSHGAEQSMGQSEITTVVVKLAQGHKVWVQAVSGSDFLGGPHSFFTGALLYTY